MNPMNPKPAQALPLPASRAYLEGQWDFVNRFITPIPRRKITYLLSPPDPPSNYAAWEMLNPTP